MGRIVTLISVANVKDPARALRCDALVDTGASHLVLPRTWKERLGELDYIGMIELETATQQTVQGEVCGPVRIQLEGFRPVHGDVVFVEMTPQDGTYEPLVGYIVLEQSQAAVDLVGHRLIRVGKMDLK